MLVPLSRKAFTLVLTLVLLTTGISRGAAVYAASSEGSGRPFQQTPVLSIRGREILADGKPVRGMFVFWHIPSDAAAREKKIRAELGRIRNLGFTGVSIETGWKECFPAEGLSALGKTAADSVIRWAAEEGLWVQLLITPHYVPDWVFRKHGDIQMRGTDGQPVDGQFLPFSPYSPAVSNLVAFQRAAVRHFSRYPNILCFWLTNEMGFGKGWPDRSQWGLSAWRHWLGRVQPDVAFWNQRWGTSLEKLDDAVIPSEGEGTAWMDWTRFRRLSLIEFWNTLYEEACRARRRFIPVGHKISAYQAVDAFASPFGLHLSWRLFRADVLGFDNYGVSAGLLALQQSAPCPVIISETNLPRTAETLNGKARTLRMLLQQSLAGAAIQTIYAWNEFDPEAFPWGTRYSDGTVLKGAEAALEMATLMRDASCTVGRGEAADPAVAVVLPASALSVRSADHERFQGVLDAVADLTHRAGAVCLAVMSDDLAPDAYLHAASHVPSPPEAPGGASLLRFLPESVRLIWLPGDIGFDQAFLESPALQKWVAAGGILSLGYREQGPPAWTGIRQARREGLQLVSTTPASGRWAFRQREYTGVGILELAGTGEGPPPEVAVMAVLERSQEPVALRVRRGEGLILYAGLPMDGSGLRGRDAGYVQDALELAGVIAPALPPGPRIQISDGRMLLWTDSDWTGKVAAPGEIASLTVYDRDSLRVENPELRAAGSILTGTLYQDQFAVVCWRTPDSRH
ncbi:MAG: beta-galactosidase [Armatimonadota bacterium]